jgi:tRNA U34 5-carboxymethylaminomethyl modifying GTPase MnmE/TrmE
MLMIKSKISIFSSLKQLFSKRIRHQSSACIYAVASGINQRCGVAVLRISGKESPQVMLKLTKTNSLEDAYEPRKMYLKDIWHPISNEKIDKGLIVWFKG